jgi:hypothetical protein
LDALASEQAAQLLANPSLVRVEIDRRLAELRADDPAGVQREGGDQGIGPDPSGNRAAH